MKGKFYLIIICILFILLFLHLYLFYIWYIRPYPTIDVGFALRDINSAKYDINKYNCQNYSMDLKNRLKDYNVLFVAGYKESGHYIIYKESNENINIFYGTIPKGIKGHEWLYLVDYNTYIEATDGTLILNQNITFK